MSLQIIKETGVKYDPVFLKILEDIPGGVTIKTNRFPTTTKEIKKGALLNADASSAGLYNVIKSIKLTAAHLFKVGEYIHIYGVTAGTITRVAATGIVCAVIGHTATATGTVLAEAEAAATTDYAVKYAASAVLRNTIKVRETGVETLLDNVFSGAIVRGTVDESELPYFVTNADKTALTARIRFA
jgi:hypothetical protein